MLRRPLLIVHEAVQERHKEAAHILTKKQLLITPTIAMRYLTTRYTPKLVQDMIREDERKRALEIEEMEREHEWLPRYTHLLPRMMTRLRRKVTERQLMFEIYKLLEEILKELMKIKFVLPHRLFFPEHIETRMLDLMFLELPEPERERILERFKQIALGRCVTWVEMMEDPILRAWLQRYFSMFRRYPCRHRVYAIKLTPLMFNYFQELPASIYLLRWGLMEAVKADPYLGRAWPVGFQMLAMTYKPDWEKWNALIAVADGVISSEQRITFMRNSFGNPWFYFRLGLAVYAEHLVRYFFAKMIGMEERVTVLHHCSIYAKIAKKSQAYRLARRGDVTMVRRFRRKFIKDSLYYAGLRG